MKNIFLGEHPPVITTLEGAADNLFASPPRPQPLRFEALSLQTPPKNVPPTPGTATTKKLNSVVLNELTKAPFEPMKDTDLKRFTLNPASLLTLASCKCRSEIHAWFANKVSNLGQWANGQRPMGKSCLVPFFRFHSQKPTSKRRFLKVCLR